MKRLLTIFSAFVLGSGSAFGVASCKTRPKHIIDDEEVNTNKDLEIWNQIKDEAEQTFKAWWDTKATVDINDYPDQIPFFTDLVTAVEKTEDSLSLTRKEIKNYRFLEQLLTGFQVEFANLNQILRNKYSNYYGDTMPLLLDDNNISFRLYHINFDKITKLIKRTPQAILGITLKVTILYEVRFKKLYNNGIIDNEVVISNNLDALSNIQESLLDYFLIFIDELFKKQEYKIIVNLEQNIIRLNQDILGSQLVSECIRQNLREEGILFSSFVSFNYDRFIPLGKRTLFDKSTAVWAWAGEGYNPMKLTPENFLKFYKKWSNLENHNDDYYLKAKIWKFIIDSNFMIENLPFNNKTSAVTLKKPINVIIAKDEMDQQLQEFAEGIMDFLKYYELETYKENRRLVFNIQQAEFVSLLKNISGFDWGQKSEITDLSIFFEPIFIFFQNTLGSRKKNFQYYIYNYAKIRYKINLIKKEKSFVIELFWQKFGNKIRLIHNLNFGFNNFWYSFFPYLNESDCNSVNDEFSFLQIIEFKVS